jgi:CDGSH-type Zn-finger protein
MHGSSVYVEADGPYVVTGDFELVAPGAPRDDASVVLCRCGRSSNKPYCDGTHTKIGFADPGNAALPVQPPPAATSDRLTIVPLPNGPLKCGGPFALFTADGTVHQVGDAKLCRCGSSASKPFCDGSHRRIAFAG